MLTIISRTGMRMVLHSPMPTTASNMVYLAIVGVRESRAAQNGERSINTRLFYLVLKQRIPDFTIKFAVSTGNVLTAAKHRNGILPTLQHSLDRARASKHHTQERYKRDLDQFFHNCSEWIRFGHYVFVNTSDGVTKHRSQDMQLKDLIEFWGRTITTWSSNVRSCLKGVQL